MGSTKLILTLLVVAVIAATSAKGVAETAVDETELREEVPDDNIDLRELLENDNGEGDEDKVLLDEDAENLAKILSLLAEKHGASETEENQKTLKKRSWTRFTSWVRRAVSRTKSWIRRNRKIIKLVGGIIVRGKKK